MLYYTIIIKE